jgi:uncharacterized protein YjiS (DUF1127 family)
MTPPSGSSANRIVPIAVIGAVSAYPVAVLRGYALWASRRRSRNALSHLSEAGLRDIGLDHAARDAECRQPFWK